MGGGGGGGGYPGKEKPVTSKLLREDLFRSDSCACFADVGGKRGMRGSGAGRWARNWARCSGPDSSRRSRRRTDSPPRIEAGSVLGRAPKA